MNNTSCNDKPVYNVLLLGKSWVGKSTLITSYLGGENNHKMNDGRVNILWFNTNKGRIKVRVYDCQTPNDSHVKGVNISFIIYMFDMKDRSTFESSIDSYDSLHLNTIPSIICGNKCDLVSDELITTITDIVNKSVNITFYPISARTFHNCKQLFLDMLRHLYDDKLNFI
jgi:GTPase SAR1 family protein